MGLSSFNRARELAKKQEEVKVEPKPKVTPKRVKKKTTEK